MRPDTTIYHHSGPRLSILIDRYWDGFRCWRKGRAFDMTLGFIYIRVGRL